MRILFLDDEPERHITFYNNNKDHELEQVTLPARAIQTLIDYSFDEVWLDHDLGFIELSNNPSIHSSFIEINSKPVVDWIVENKTPEQIPKIIVHSWNAPAADWMTKRLQDFGFNVIKAPFGFSNKKGR